MTVISCSLTYDMANQVSFFDRSWGAVTGSKEFNFLENDDLLAADRIRAIRKPLLVGKIARHGAKLLSPKALTIGLSIVTFGIVYRKWPSGMRWFFQSYRYWFAFVGKKT